MKKFRIVEKYKEFEFIQDAGFEFDFSEKYSDDFEKFAFSESRKYDKIDSFYDGDVKICEDEKGELYGVDFAVNKNDEWVPCIWQKLKRVK